MARKPPVLTAPSTPDHKQSRDDWFEDLMNTLIPEYQKAGMKLPPKIEWQLAPNGRRIHTVLGSFPDSDANADGWAVILPGSSIDPEVLVTHVCQGLDMALYIQARMKVGQDYKDIAIGTALYKRKGVQEISNEVGLIHTNKILELTIRGRALAASLKPYPGNKYPKKIASKGNPRQVKQSCPICLTAVFHTQNGYEDILLTQPEDWRQHHQFCYIDGCTRTAAGVPMTVSGYDGDVLLADAQVIILPGGRR